MDSNLFRGWAQFVPPATMGVAMRLYASQELAERHPVIYNLVISNVAGPELPAVLPRRQDRGDVPARARCSMVPA